VGGERTSYAKKRFRLISCSYVETTREGFGRGEDSEKGSLGSEMEEGYEGEGGLSDCGRHLLVGGTNGGRGELKTGREAARSRIERNAR